ncbi:MAG: class II glutamine amidotransferase [Burkholderiaceae bacterium]|nr:class II glutamine amidotransferase [Burkholderiaceae bacterium]
MCELLAMSSRQPTRLTFSLEALAARSGAASGTRDGWGAAFYQGHDAALFREPAAASDSPLVRFLETQGPSTTLALSHIRRATLGTVTLANTQPFVRELAGRTHVFAHNGHLPGIDQSRNFAHARFHPVGETDSEHAFCALMARLCDLWRPSFAPPPIEERLAVVAAFAADLRQLGPANFLYADGEVLFAHGHRRIQSATGRIEPPGLFLLSRQCSHAHESVQAQGLSIAPGFQEVTLIASVPLSNEAWRPLDEGEIVAVSAGRLVTRHAD